MSKPQRIAVIGDLLVDHTVFVRPSKIAQEAPVLVGDVLREEFRNGGAGAVNDLISAFGVDSKLAICRVMTGIPVSRKMRIVAESSSSRPQQILLRLDQNASFQWPDTGMSAVCGWLKEYQPTAVVISDYGKGTIVEGVVPEIRQAVGVKVPILIDPYTVDWSKYAGGDIILPSRSAAAEFLQDEDPRGFSVVIPKLDYEGCRIYGLGAVESLPSQARCVIDPCGAGDQFIATLAAHLGTGLPLKRAVWLANLAAGMQCERAGIVPVMVEELMQRAAEIDCLTEAV